MPAPRGRMAGEATRERRGEIIRATGLGDLRPVGAHCSVAAFVRSHDRDMARLVVVMIPVCGDDQLAAIGCVLCFHFITQRSPALRRAGAFEPVVLRIREQDLLVFGRTQDVDAELLRRRGDEGTAMRVFAHARFGLAVGIA